MLGVLKDGIDDADAIDLDPLVLLVVRGVLGCVLWVLFCRRLLLIWYDAEFVDVVGLVFTSFLFIDLVLVVFEVVGSSIWAINSSISANVGNESNVESGSSPPPFATTKLSAFCSANRDVLVDNDDDDDDDANDDDDNLKMDRVRCRRL